MNSLPAGLLALRHDSDCQKIIPATLADENQKRKSEPRYAQRSGLVIGVVGQLDLGGKKIRYPGLLGEKVNKSLIGQRYI